MNKSNLHVTLSYFAAISGPDPVAVYPLNSKYLSREIKDRLPPGILSHVSWRLESMERKAAPTNSQEISAVTLSFRIMED